MRLKKRKMDLHIFDAADGGGSAAEGAAGADSAMGDTTTTDTNTQVSDGRGADGTVNNSQDADVNNQTDTNANNDDEARAAFKARIRGEDKKFFDESVQNVINKRFKETKDLESRLEKFQPLLSAIAEDYGLTDLNDSEAIINAYLNNEQRLMDRASRNGLSVDQQKQFDTMQGELDKFRQEEAIKQQAANEQALRTQWANESQEIIENLDSDFNLDEAFQNDEFYNAVVKQNLPLKMAYFCAFHDKYDAKIAEKAEKKVTDNIKARGSRVAENGTTPQATASSQFNVSNMSGKQIMELAKRAERGERIDFNNL